MTFIFVLALLGWLGFSVMWVVALFKRHGTAKRNFTLGVVCFLVFMISGNFVETDEEVAAKKPEIAETVASDDKAKETAESESKNTVKEQVEIEKNEIAQAEKAEAEKEAKAKAEKEAAAKKEKKAKEQAAKEKAEAEALAKAEAEAKKPISTDFTAFDLPYEDMTDIQKKAFWDDVKGKRVQWTGTVTEVTKDSIQLKIKSTTFVSDVIATVAKDERDKLITINLDETITINGELSSKKGIIMPWSLSDTVIME